MGPHLNSMEATELHDLVSDCVVDLPRREVPSIRKGFIEVQQRGEKLLTTAMARLIVARVSFTGNSRWRDSKVGNLLLGPRSSEVDVIQLVDLENPDNSRSIHVDFANQPEPVSVVRGNLVTREFSTFADRMPTEADLAMLNRVIGAFGGPELIE